MALVCRENNVTSRIEHKIWQLIEERLQSEEWRSAQVSGWLMAEAGGTVSHEWIYQYVLAGKAQSDNIHHHLRCQGQRKKRYGNETIRGKLTNRSSIDAGPYIVHHRARYGDWELDTIIVKGNKKAIVSLTE